MAILGVLVAVVQTLLLELELVGLEHLDKVTQVVLSPVVLTGLAVVAVELLRLVQITQP